eukprot:1141169-Pelagomonas_calceolata.AAC.1
MLGLSVVCALSCACRCWGPPALPHGTAAAPAAQCVGWGAAAEKREQWAGWGKADGRGDRVLVQGVMRLIAFHALRPFHWVWVFSQEWAASLSDVATDPVGDACPCLHYGGGEWEVRVMSNYKVLRLEALSLCKAPARFLPTSIACVTNPLLRLNFNGLHDLTAEPLI